MKYYNEYKKAVEYRCTGQNAKALEIIEKINKLDPECELVKLELAKMLIIKGKKKNKRIARKILLELCNTKREYSAILELGKLELSEGNYDVAEKLFKSLLDTTWEDYALFQLSFLEEQRENKDEAENYLMLLLNSSNNSCKISKESLDLRLAEIKMKQGKYSEAHKLFENLLYECGDRPETKINKARARRKLIFLNIKEENYEKAYAYLQEIDDIIEEKQEKRLNNVRFYLEHKLGILKDPDSYKSYFSKQVVDYNENEALNHIKSHLCENEKKFNHTIFYDDINIEKLFNDVKTKIQSEPIKELALNDYYMIDCGYPIGMIDKKETTNVKVITLPNTKDIISMYPVLSFDKTNDYSCDLDEMETCEKAPEETKITEKLLVKKKTRLSQIDKFNKRYGNI